MPDDLERQLEAFGRTLRDATGEPIVEDLVGSRAPSAPRSTRRWALVGAAACFVVAFVGIGWVVGNRSSAPSAAVGTTQPEGAPVATVAAPDVPVDALRLDDVGWTLTRHSRSAFVVIDAMSCGEMRELTALSGHEVVVEEYRGPTDDAWMMVTHAAYADRATAEDRIRAFTDLRNCPDANLDGYEQLDLDAGTGIAAMGHRQSGSAQVAFIDDDGEAVLVRVGNDSSDATLQLLTERSAALLRGQLDPLPPDATATGLDDLAAVVGDDPVDLLADGWTLVSYGLTGFETQTWPVCGPPGAVAALAAVPALDTTYVSPSGEGVWVRFLRVDDPVSRTGLGNAFVVESECPASSQPGFGASLAVDSDPERGRWRRSEPDITSVLVAPPVTRALPLVVIVTGAADSVDAFADRAADFLTGGGTAPVDDPVGDDPLGLERDGWSLVQRTTDPFSLSSDEIPCAVADVVEQINGLHQVHDILTPPDGTGLDLDVQILDVGSLDRGLQLADFVDVIGRCVDETRGIAIETGAMSSIRASWFRAGPDFALVAIVGEGARSIVLEIEGAPFDDDLIGELAHRADQFLRGEPISPQATDGDAISATALSGVDDAAVEPVAGQVKLWVGNQSFEDDPVAITVQIDGVMVVDDAFEVGSQHNWFSFMIDGLEPGEDTLTATSDTGAAFEGTFTLPPDEPRWVLVDYWYYTDDAEGRHFTFSESDEPIYFA